MSWFSRKTTVTFIDDATGSPFGNTELPPDKLPDSFDIESTLHLEDGDWSVVDASPRTKAEYSKSRQLSLRLRRVERIDPNKILFSLPTICDFIPAIGAGTLTGNECVLDEDDWRQLEFVSLQCATESEAEIAEIRRIHEQEGAGVGWRNLHVRSRPDPPIVTPLTLDDLDQAFGGVLFTGVTYHGAKAPIVSGYSFKTADGLQGYGIAEQRLVTVLGIINGNYHASMPSLDALDGLVQKFELELIHWCRCERTSFHGSSIRQILVGNNA